MPAGNGHSPRIFYRALVDNVNKNLSFNVENDDIWMKNRIIRNNSSSATSTMSRFQLFGRLVTEKIGGIKKKTNILVIYTRIRVEILLL